MQNKWLIDLVNGTLFTPKTSEVRFGEEKDCNSDFSINSEKINRMAENPNG
jgi:hypothetical protein